jgi:hypothetical protein
MQCNRTLLSLFLDRELSSTAPLELHLQQCAACQAWLKDMATLEQRIYAHEQEQHNFVLLAIFDVARQRRQAEELGWGGLWLGFADDGRFASLPAHTSQALHFYLQAFWYGQTGIYVENLAFPCSVVLHRGRRYLPLPVYRSKRLIESDSIIVQDSGNPLLKLTWQLPASFKEGSITRKYKSLSLVSGSFIARFFQKTHTEADMWRQWKMVKHSLSARELGIYLMHLKGGSSYKKIASAFHVSPHHVAHLIVTVRSSATTVARAE